MKKILSILFVFVVMTSCVDLEEPLYDRIPLEKYPENDIQGALSTGPIYEAMRGFVEDWGGWFFAQEVTSDELVFPTRHTDWDDGGKWRVLYDHTWTNTTEAVNNMWRLYYQGIGEANRLLDQMGTTSEDPSVMGTISKIKIMRAYYYWLLIDNYGDVPYVTSFSDAEEFPSKDARADIWTSIVEEVEESIPHLPDSYSKTSVSRGMAFMLLAKLYLNAGVYTGTAHWAEAEEACDSVLALNYVLETNPLAPFKTENQFSSENIFTIPYDEDSYQGFTLHRRTLHYLNNLTFDMTVGPWNGCAVTKQHYDTYEDDDIRKKDGFLVGQQYTSSGAPIFDEVAGVSLVFDPDIPALYLDGSYSPEKIRNSGARIVKFEIAMGAKANLSNDFPIFRLADAYLMKAETMLRQGKSAVDAVTYVNPIRERANVDPWTGADLTLESLLAERGREMFFEGHRRQDLIRFGEFDKAWWEKPATGPERDIFPIPQWVIDSNPNLAN
jgi:hypothetical protein